MIQNWELMEKYWHRSVYDYLNVEPQNHNVVLTEPPMNTPENREQMAEIWFETFDVKGLYIGVQAVLALYAGVYAKQEGNAGIQSADLTGTVVDSGDGVTHVIPVFHGVPISGSIKHIPIAGRNITEFVLEHLRARKEPIPNKEYKEVARDIKEKYGYCSPDILKEFSKFDAKEQGKDGSWGFTKKGVKTINYTTPVLKKQIKLDLGYEMFLGPEVFFHPEFVNKDYRESIDEVVDHSIMMSPIDTRVGLYNNIILSGGSTQFKNFDKRLEQEVRRRVKTRYEGLAKQHNNENLKDNAPDVKVSQNIVQNFAVFFGASVMASQNTKIFRTREEYLEYGPSIARHNDVFGGGM